jgi:hypothetical protein
LYYCFGKRRLAGVFRVQGGRGDKIVKATHALGRSLPALRQVTLPDPSNRKARSDTTN